MIPVVTLFVKGAGAVAVVVVSDVSDSNAVIFAVN